MIYFPRHSEGSKGHRRPVKIERLRRVEDALPARMGEERKAFVGSDGADDQCFRLEDVRAELRADGRHRQGSDVDRLRISMREVCRRFDAR